MDRKMRGSFAGVAIAVGILVGACGRRSTADGAGASVSVELLAQDSAAARFRVCNNGFQPIHRVEFTAGRTALVADTSLGQAHCAEVTIPGRYPRLDSLPLVVTKASAP